MLRNFAQYLAIAMVLLIFGCDQVDVQSTAALNASAANPVFSMDVADPGSLHNDMVRSYVARRPLGGPPVTRTEFVRTIVAASNEAFAANGIPPALTARDTERVLAMIHELRRENVFDFFSREPGETVAIVDYWEAKGIVSPSDAAAVRFRLGSRGRYSGQNLAIDGGGSAALKGFDSVYHASRDLWSNRGTGGILKSGSGAPQLLTREETMFELDAIGLLFGWFLGGPTGGTFAAYLFSIAFIELPAAGGGDDGWECLDYGMC